jgi:hypothetical protein
VGGERERGREWNNGGFGEGARSALVLVSAIGVDARI